MKAGQEIFSPIREAKEVRIDCGQGLEWKYERNG